MQNIGHLILFLLIIGLSCAKSPKMLETHFSAHITVADSIDNTGDYSGFEFLVFNRQNLNDPIDTLFFEKTDTTGLLKGIIPFKSPGAYPAQLNRNGRNLATFRFLLADKDTITLSAELPGLEQTLNIDSREQRAMAIYNRVDASFKRVNRFIQAGKVPAEKIPAELNIFADLFWQVFEERKGTFASKLAFENVITLLQVVDQNQMMAKINNSFDEEYAFAMAITLGKKFVADSRGFEHTITYLDSVQNLSSNKTIKAAFEQAIIKLHLDSLYINEAKQLLSKYKRRYEDKEEHSIWYENIYFELYELTPGEPAPDFEFITTEGDTVNNQSLLGNPFILEFTLLANKLYQQQYDESIVIYQLYNAKGLNYFTIPFDESVNTIIGFYEERDRFWALADPPSINYQTLIDDFNLQFYPTWILIDADGNMVRKYIGEEFEGIIPGINETLITKKQ